MDPVPAPDPTDKERTYTVKSGDSMWSIAERELGDGVRFTEILRLNGLNGYTIYPGQVLKLPAKEKKTEPDPVSYTTVTVRVRWDVLQRWEEKAGSRTLGEYLEEIL